MQHVQQLSEYLELLSCLYQNNQATKTTKKVGLIKDANFVCHILCVCPGTRQVQYKLKADVVPQYVCNLLGDLEKTKKAFPTVQE